MRTLRICAVFLISSLLPSALSADWLPYNFFQVGAKGMALGGAFTSLADDLGAFYANPAGLVQVDRPALTYQLYSSLRVQRLIDTTLTLDWEYFPLVAYALPLGAHSTVGAFVHTMFKSPGGTYSVYGTGLSFSTRIAKNFAVGLNTGLAIGIRDDDRATGWFVQTGAMVILSASLRAGLVLRLPVRLQWDQLRADVDVEERLPWSAQFGISYRLSKIAIASFEIEYQGWNAVHYSSEGVDMSPNLATGLFRSWHPHAGIQFLHEPSGAQIRAGLMTVATASSEELTPQPVLTLGIGAYTGDFFRIDFALLDTLIFDIFTRTDRFEQFLLSFEFIF